jgi:hypothetical protein
MQRHFCWIWIFIPVLAACNALRVGEVEPTLEPTSGASPSAATEIAWFPPTVTPSPETNPTQQPTPDMKPGIGPVILDDNFLSGSQWSAITSDQAAVTLSDQGLVIAAQPGTASVVSFRKGVVLDDLYAEISARPSLCRGADSYGLLFRASNDIAYYRFAIACNGTATADRVSPGGLRVLQSPIRSGEIPLGAPGEVRLGIWIMGSEFHFFLNGQYQFSASDRSYASGGIGVFVRSSGETPVTVAFNELEIHSIAAESSAETPIP